MGKLKIQAGLFPNPEAEFEADNFLGGKDFTGFRGAEYTLSASQLFELGGKRSSRVNLVESEIISAKGENKIRSLQLAYNVKTVFLKLYKITQQIKLQKQFISLNEEVLNTINKAS